MKSGYWRKHISISLGVNKIRRRYLNLIMSYEILETKIFEVLILITGLSYVLVSIISNYRGFEIIFFPPPIKRSYIEAILDKEILLSIHYNLVDLITNSTPIPYQFLYNDVSLLAIAGFISLRSSNTLTPSKFKTEMLLPISKSEYILGKLLSLLVIVSTTYIIFSSIALVLAYGIGLYIITLPIKYFPQLIFICTVAYITSVTTRNEIVSLFMSWGIIKFSESLVNSILFEIFKASSEPETSIIFSVLGIDVTAYLKYITSGIAIALHPSNYGFYLALYVVQSILYILLTLSILYLIILYLQKIQVD